jgi:hypothetical protein
MPSCFDQVARADELVEVAAVREEVADCPDGGDEQAAGVIDLALEQHPHLLGERDRVLAKLGRQVGLIGCG